MNPGPRAATPPAVPAPAGERLLGRLQHARLSGQDVIQRVDVRRTVAQPVARGPIDTFWRVASDCAGARDHATDIRPEAPRGRPRCRALRSLAGPCRRTLPGPRRSPARTFLSDPTDTSKVPVCIA